MGKSPGISLPKNINERKEVKYTYHIIILVFFRQSENKHRIVIS